MCWEAACIVSTGKTMELQFINKFAAAAFGAFKDSVCAKRVTVLLSYCLCFCCRRECMTLLI